ncbi:MAG TPA: serine hydrolase domain-containing protein [Pyrinomonadaceae bacterium]|jgi:CubicO group peptidase (beta-lactamase class C family)
MHEGERNEEISAFLGERIAAGDFPSAVYLVAERGRVRFRDALGHAVREPLERMAALDTIYDLASLTKPLVTGMLCARYVETKELKLDEEVRVYLPEFDTPDKRAVTVRHLLTHASGLPAWQPLYITTGGRKGETLRVIASQPLEAAPGARVRYSDLGFITLGLLLERISGEQLKEVARREIFEPLGLRRTFFNPEMALQTETAACETGNLYERGMCNDLKLGESYADWREQLIWGEVHDGNAHFLGGAAGHAGLFSTASETLRIAEQFLAGRTQLLKPETCALFHTNMTEGLEEARSFAWQLAGTKDSTAGQDLPSASFGHTGFTGTSCWIDPERERVFLLFTNRTHAARSLPFVNINGVRRRFHSMAAKALG